MRAPHSPSTASKPIAVLGVAAALLICACAGELDDPERFQSIDPLAACGDVFATIVTPKCAFCHSPTNPLGGLDVVSVDLPGRLLDRPATATCGGMLVPRSNVEEGYFYKSMLASNTCGAQMPVGLTALTDAEMTCVSLWLKDMVAKNP